MSDDFELAGDGAPDGADSRAADERPEEGRAPSRRRMAVFALLVLVVAGGLAFALMRLRPRPDRVEPQAAPPVVETVVARPETVQFTIRSQGTVRPVTESVLAAQVAGRVVAISSRLREGALFERGEILVRIDPADYRLALRDAEAALEQARARLQRVEAEAEIAREELDLVGDLGGDTTPLARYEPQLAEARAGLAAAEGALERARLSLGRTAIEAPFDGRVRARQVDVGQVVGPGTPVASVFGTEAAEVMLPITKEEAGFLGAEVAFAGEVPPGLDVTLEGVIGGAVRRWPGTLVRTGGEIDPRTRMLALYARVEDPYRRATPIGGVPLPVGLFVEARIPGRSVADAFVLPRSALSSAGDIFVIDADDRLRIRQVEVLRAAEDRVIVGAGLRPGERVVVSRLEVVTDGMEVRPVSASEAAPPEGGAE